ncbi:hypothetical protein [Pandoraea faecigallinarum]|uniref:hypothetical protein n=1 Tax=Pandoraea faecigallinarum TaxID=656179 RepID=UPI000B2F31B0|nr:hypothetical protein [Pandoraea faecigallinarum]
MQNPYLQMLVGGIKGLWEQITTDPTTVFFAVALLVMMVISLWMGPLERRRR